MSPYEHALAFWYGRINYEQTPPCPDDFRLERMRALLRALGDPQARLRVVHVAGSKGKGSTAAMLAGILTRAGYRTALFTSPHLTRVEERFQIDGVPIAAAEIITLIDVIRAACALHRLQPTFFEVATALGFLHFVHRRADLAVLEVGLGGRFDSTNVCQPLVAVITTISLDHTRQLGDRLASIAFEKAGIIKPGRPIVSGVVVPEASEVIATAARQRHAPLSALGVDFHYRFQPGRVTGTAQTAARVQVTTATRRWPELELNLLGEHQALNAAVAIRTVEELRRTGLHVSDTAVRTGLANVQWPARLEIMQQRPLVVLDCAHNVASVEALVAALAASFPPGRRLLVLACSSDKDLAGMARVLTPHFAHAYLTRFHNSTRAAEPELLAELFRQAGKVAHSVHADSSAAWAAARRDAGPDDLICVTGSVFLAGELRPVLLDSAAQ